MKKFIAAMVLVLLSILPVFKEAVAVTVNFDNLAVGNALFDQYNAEGIYFRDQLSLSGNSVGNIVGNGSANILQLPSLPTAMFILLANPAHHFSFDKWEPKPPEQPQDPPQEAPVQQDAPTEEAPSEYTVYWEFFKNDGTGYQSVGLYQNSTKDDWVRVPFTFNEQISAVMVYGDIVGSQTYYLDNLQFETTSSAVPEPTTMLLLGLGLIGLAGIRKKMR